MDSPHGSAFRLSVSHTCRPARVDPGQSLFLHPDPLAVARAAGGCTPGSGVAERSRSDAVETASSYSTPHGVRSARRVRPARAAAPRPLDRTAYGIVNYGTWTSWTYA